MKNLRVIPSLLATLLVVSNVVAQTTAGPATDALSEPSGISAARSKYLEKTADAVATKNNQTEAQLPRRGRGMPAPPRRGYYGGGSATPWMADSDPGHALIGAGIGFAVGAAIGAAGAVHNGTPVGGGVFIGGSLFGLLGAAIGATHGAGHPFVHRRRTYPAWPEDDEEGHLRSPATERNSQATLSPSQKATLPSESNDVGASAATSPEAPSRPVEPTLGTVSFPKTQN